MRRQGQLQPQINRMPREGIHCFNQIAIQGRQTHLSDITIGRETQVSRALQSVGGVTNTQASCYDLPLAKNASSSSGLDPVANCSGEPPCFESRLLTISPLRGGPIQDTWRLLGLSR